MAAIAESIPFLPVGVVFAVGVFSLVNSIYESRWLPRLIAMRGGSRLQYALIGLVCIIMSLAMVYGRDDFDPGLTMDTLMILLGFGVVVAAAYSRQRRGG